MGDGIVKFELEGAPERRGDVLARVFLTKLAQFVRTLGRFERAYLDNAGKRQTEFEIAGLHHASAHVDLRPVPRVPNYVPQPALIWTFSQIDLIASGRAADARVGPELVQQLANFTMRSKEYDFKRLRACYNQFDINFDKDLLIKTIDYKKAVTKNVDTFTWLKGASYGSLLGQLMSVLNANGERQLIICPPTGIAQVMCVFPDELRERIGHHLFKPVRVRGLMHYDGSGPFPSRIEVTNLEPLADDGASGSFLDAEGLFAASPPAEPVDLWPEEEMLG